MDAMGFCNGEPKGIFGFSIAGISRQSKQNLNHRVLMRNELLAQTNKILKALKIAPPSQVLSLEKQA